MFKKKKFQCNISEAAAQPSSETSSQRVSQPARDPDEVHTNQTVNADGSTPDPRSMLEAMINKVVHAAGSQAGMVALYEGDRPFYTASVGLGEGEARSLAASLRSMPELQGEAGEQQAQHTLGLTLSPAEAVSGVARLKGHDLHLVAIPLRGGDGMVGLLCLLEPGEGGDREDIFNRPDIYQIIVDQVDIVAQNTRLLQRILNEKHWLEEVIQQTSEAILVVDPQRRIIGLNRALERLTGWTGPLAWGQDAEQLFDFHTAANSQQSGSNYSPSFDLPRWDSGQSSNLPAIRGQHVGDGWLTEQLTATLNDSSYVAVQELTLLAHDGRRVPVEASCGLIRGNDGAVLGATLTLHDIRARKEAEAMQATFLSVVSHELQTPIAVIKGYAGLLGDTIGEENATARQQLEIVSQESDRLSKMVENLMTVTRLQAGKLDINREPLDPYSLLNRVATRLRVLVAERPERRLTVAPYPPKGDEVAGEEQLPVVIGDEQRIEQVLTNLVENSLKYGAGEITLAAERRASHVLFSVSDEGEGVPAEERERIFTPFTRLEGRMVREAKGVGLGLYIAREIINALGGSIWVEEAASGGARFAFTLPVSKED